MRRYMSDARGDSTMVRKQVDGVMAGATSFLNFHTQSVAYDILMSHDLKTEEKVVYTALANTIPTARI
jgi:hypothetical protein